MSFNYDDDNLLSSNLLGDQPFQFPIMDGILKKIEEYDFEYDRQVSYIFESVAASELNEMEQNGDDIQKNDENISTTGHCETKNDAIKIQHDYSIDILQYNVNLAEKSKRANSKRTPQKRVLDPFLMKLKKTLKKFIIQMKPHVNMKKLENELNNLPGMKKSKGMKELNRLFKINKICGISIDMPNIISSYLCSNQSLLDGLYPRQNNDGGYSKKRCKQKTAENYPFFLPTYELMSKFFIENESEEIKQQEKEHNLSQNYQNIWYYSLTTSTKYEQFYQNE